MGLDIFEEVFKGWYLIYVFTLHVRTRELLVAYGEIEARRHPRRLAVMAAVLLSETVKIELWYVCYNILIINVCR